MCYKSGNSYTPHIAAAATADAAVASLLPVPPSCHGCIATSGAASLVLTSCGHCWHVTVGSAALVWPLLVPPLRRHRWCWCCPCVTLASPPVVLPSCGRCWCHCCVAVGGAGAALASPLRHRLWCCPHVCLLVPWLCHAVGGAALLRRTFERCGDNLQL